MRKYLIDVGSSWNGHNTKEWRQMHGYLPIIFIEPDTEAYNKLQIDKEDIKLPIAINIEDGKIDFNFYQEGTHSILKTNTNEIPKYIDGYTGKSAKIEDWTPKKIVSVPCLRMDTLLKTFSIDKIEFLKIDTQGFDLNVIKSLGERIKDVKYIICEVQIMSFELYLNCSKKDDIIEYMKNNNFILVYSEKQTYDQEENLFFKNLNYKE